MPRPRGKARKASTSDSDSGPDDRTPVKKSKTDDAKDTKASSAKSDNKEDSWDLGKNRFVSLTEFKGKFYVNIREFYMADGGDLRPGKKGIMLTMEQWQKFKTALPEVEEAIKRRV